MKEKILQKLYLGFVQLHILYHSKKSPIYGVWMMEELKAHGYNVGPGTIYPILNRMAASGLLEKTRKNVNGKIRKYYTITRLGIEVFEDAGKKAAELFHEIEETDE
jgi:DNA-binding PadR family transcriptional regulator